MVPFGSGANALNQFLGGPACKWLRTPGVDSQPNQHVFGMGEETRTPEKEKGTSWSLQPFLHSVWSFLILVRNDILLLCKRKTGPYCVAK